MIKWSSESASSILSREESPSKGFFPPPSALDIETTAHSKIPVDMSCNASHASSGEEVIDEKAQAGTQKAQASTQAWTQTTLVAAYILYVVFFRYRRDPFN